MKGCTIPVADISPESAFGTQTQAAATVPRNIRWKSDQPGNARRKNAKRRARAHEGVTETRATQADKDPANQASDTSPITTDGSKLVPGYSRHLIDSIDEVIDQSDDLALALAPVPTSPGPIHPWIAPLSPQARMLMSHCKYPFSLSS